MVDRNSAVNMNTGYRRDDRSSIPHQTAWAAFPGVKEAGASAYSPTSYTEI